MKRFASVSALVLLAATPLLAQPVDQSEATIGPDYTPVPELAIPHGNIIGFAMESTDSKIYPGIARIDNETMARRDAWGNRLAAPLEGNARAQAYSRRVTVYVPPLQQPLGRGAMRPALPFMVVQDGSSYVARMVPVLDSLIAQKRIPAIAVIFVNSGGSDAQNSQRGLEYDAMDGKYAEFIETEVLPRAAREANITFTTDRAEHGLVSPRMVQPGAELFRHLREPGLAAGCSDAARRLGVSRQPDPQFTQEAVPHLDAGGRKGPAFRRSGTELAQLADGQPAHGSGAEGQGL